VEKYRRYPQYPRGGNPRRSQSAASGASHLTPRCDRHVECASAIPQHFFLRPPLQNQLLPPPASILCGAAFLPPTPNSATTIIDIPQRAELWKRPCLSDLAESTKSTTSPAPLHHPAARCTRSMFLVVHRPDRESPLPPLDSSGNEGLTAVRQHALHHRPMRNALARVHFQNTISAGKDELDILVIHKDVGRIGREVGLRFATSVQQFFGQLERLVPPSIRIAAQASQFRCRPRGIGRLSRHAISSSADETRKAPQAKKQPTPPLFRESKSPRRGVRSYDSILIQQIHTPREPSLRQTPSSPASDSRSHIPRAAQ